MKPTETEPMTALHQSNESGGGCPLSWPYAVLHSRSDPQGGATLITDRAPTSSGSLAVEKSFQRIEKAALNDPTRMKWLLNTMGVLDFILCENLFIAGKKKGCDVDGIWKTIKDTPHLTWIIAVADPDALASHFPNDWGKEGYANVCFAVVVDGDAEAKSRQLQALKETPVCFRAVWLRSGHNLEMSDDWLYGIDWLIADSTNEGPSLLPAAAVEWVAKIRAACRAKGIAFFHNHLGDDDSAASVEGTDDPPAHPFAKKIKPESSTKLAQTAKPDSVATSEMPSPVSISEVEDDGVVASPAIIGRDVCNEVADASGPEKPATSPSQPDKSEFAVIVPEIVTDFRIDEVDIDTKWERFEELDATVRRGLKAWVEAGIALLEIRGDELWREGGYASFDDYCNFVLGLKANYANRIAKHAVIAVELSKAKVPMDEAGNPILPQNEFQCRALAKLEGLPQWLKAWRLSVKRASGMPTAAIVAEVVGELKAKNSPPKVPVPSLKERLKELTGRLRQAVDAESLDLLREIATEFENLA